MEERYLYRINSIDELHYIMDHMEPHVELEQYEEHILDNLPSVSEFTIAYFKELRKTEEFPSVRSREDMMYGSTEQVLKNMKKYRSSKKDGLE